MKATDTPPSHDGAEMSLLGRLLLDNEQIHKVEISVDLFYQTKHKIIFKAIKDKISKGHKIDVVALSAKLVKEKNLDFVGGAIYLAKLLEMPCHETKVYYSILVKCKLKRDLLSLASRIRDNVFSGLLSTSELMDETHKKLDLLSKDSTNEEFVEGKDLLNEVLDDIENEDEALKGQQTGFKKLDYLIEGLKDGDFWTLGAASGVGKSAAAISIISNLIKDGNKPAVFNLEMTNKGVMRRLLSLAANVCGRRLKNGNINDSEWKKVSSAVGDISKSSLFLNDNPYCTLSQLVNQSRKLVRDKGVNSIWVDHMGLIQRDKGFIGDERLWLVEVANSLKRLAKELDVPVVALSQLKQKDYSDSNLPLKYDLHGSKSVAEACDGILLLHRDELDVSAERQNALFLVRKQREGETGIIRVNFYGSTTKFSEDSPL